MRKNRLMREFLNVANEIEKKIETDNLSYKICIVGDQGCGKTSIAHQYINGKFIEAREITFVDFFLKKELVNDEEITLQIWDTTGFEKFRAIVPKLYRDAQVIILVFSLDNEESFESLDYWMNDFADKCTWNPVIILVGNKTDMDCVIDNQEIITYAMNNRMIYFATSAKKDYGIKELFEYVAKISRTKTPIKKTLTIKKSKPRKQCAC